VRLEPKGSQVMRRPWISLFTALVLSAGSIASANTSSHIPESAVPAVTCIYLLFKSSPDVQSVDVYAIDELRSAVEYRFKEKDGNVIVGDLMLLASPVRVTYNIKILPNEPEKAGWASLEFSSKLNVSSKCHVFPALDSLVPGPKPRAEWQEVDWPIPATSPSAPH
jgi:hypothetical protein